MQAYNNILNIMRNAGKREGGWLELIDEKKNIEFRSIRIGNHISCNGDLLKDTQIMTEIKKIFHDNNIDEYRLSEIDNKLEYSIEIKLKEEIYNDFINKISSNSDRI
tara:strand:+ start:388 stop:708 length:321 start_codon:yes stop_codon:yes gene_type:complete